ncbi:unnamed protein product [Arabidopsis arenosa]|uniref:Uncharacterized protein n=1 Tax=Arabidopsis arenosa TaxID=38785 RepID=A0A8S1ZJH5_ARAAE|nr:unnamed protein product [Arabidopsis arenosa]
MTGRGRRRRNVPNASQRAPDTSIAPKRPTTLPPQYDFTPPAVPDPRVQPPVQQPRIVPQHSTSARQASEEVRQPTPQQPTPHQPHPEDEAPPSPHSHLNSDGPNVGHSQPYSSQGNNFMEFSPMLPELEEETLQALNALLQVPDRDQFTTVLSPTPRENTTWSEFFLY